MKHIFYIIILLIVSFTLFSCSDDNESDPIGDNYLIMSKFEIKPQSSSASKQIFEFSYNTNNKIVEYTNTKTNQLTKDTIVDACTLEYNANGNIASYISVSIRPQKGYYEMYKRSVISYQNSNTISITTSVRLPLPTKEYTDVLHLNKDGKVIKMILADGNTLAYEYDANNNLKKITNETTNMVTDYLEYDDKKSFLTNSGFDQWFWVYNHKILQNYTGANNVLSYSDPHAPDITNPTTKKHTYWYNKWDMPASVYRDGILLYSVSFRAIPKK